MILSILTPTMPGRELDLLELSDCLQPQLIPGVVEWLQDPTPPPVSTGSKRQSLLLRATGDYVAMVDDDDLVSEDYVGAILSAIATAPDVVSMRGYMMEGTRMAGIFEHSLKYDRWVDNLPGLLRWGRPPNHLNPVKRVLALQAGYPDVTQGEDRDYSARLRPLLKTEIMVEKPLYLYRFSQK